MNGRTKPQVWQIVKEATESAGGKTSNVAVRDYALEHYPHTNPNTVQGQIVVCTVNHESRVHYPENQRPRKADTELDFLYRPGPGRLELFDPRLHGEWEIAQDPHGFVFVRKSDTAKRKRPEEILVGGGVIEETQLRSYLARSLNIVEEGLELFVDEMGNDGVEYQTDIGAIDLLAVNSSGDFIVILLKVERSSGEVSGQILGFMNWIRQYLAHGRTVRGYVIGTHITDNIRFALAHRDDIALKEYELNISLKDVSVSPEQLRLATAGGRE